jgi:hypothetical protein
VRSRVNGKDFTGIWILSAVNYVMTKGALLAVMGVVCLSFPVSAQQPIPADDFESASTVALYRPDIFTTVDSTVLIHDLPMVAFLDGRLAGSSPLGRMGIAPVASFPVAFMSTVPARKGNVYLAAGKDGKDAKDSPEEVTALQRKPELYFGGETGVFYGRSIGKHGGDDFGSYLEGSVGNDKVQLTVGASYEQSNVRAPRWAR